MDLYSNITIIKVSISENGTVAHTPSIPKNLGSIIIPIIINTIPLDPAIIMEAKALPIDVKYPEKITFRPLIKNANEYIFAP